MKARNLRLLRIDDEFATSGGDHPNFVAKHDPPPSYIDLFTIGEGESSIAAISGWHGALRFWQAMPAGASPDLTVCDVNFQYDETSPIVIALGDTKLESHLHPSPTGLLHLKPFAGIARALGRPVGIGLHTVNPEMWERIGSHQDGEVLAALAAQELGELAAILGDQVLPQAGPMTHEALIKNCWDWLNRRSSATFPGAFNSALAEYRRKLLRAAAADANSPRIMISPTTWTDLMAWTDDMRTLSGPINSEKEISLLYADGQEDSIRLASIFADVDGFTEELLPEECFSTDGDSSDYPPWELDERGLPQIGRFLLSLGSTVEIYQDATVLVEEFPVTRSGDQRIERNLNDAARHFVNSTLLQGLVILLQLVRWIHHRESAWQEGMRLGGWDSRSLRLDPLVPGPSLAIVLKNLFGTISSFFHENGDPAEEVSPLEILDGEHWPGAPDLNNAGSEPEWIRWHFDLLVKAGFLRRKPTGNYYSPAARFRFTEVPAPSKMPPGFPWNEDLLWEPDRIRGFLRDSLGFGKVLGPVASNNDNAVGKRLAAAFCGSTDPEKGRSFLDKLLNGEAPIWLAELLRDYATRHLNWAERTWPRWLRRSSNENRKR